MVSAGLRYICNERRRRHRKAFCVFFVQTGLQNLQDCYTVVIQDMIESYQRKMPSWFFHGAK